MKETWLWEVKMIVRTVDMLEDNKETKYVIADNEKTAVSMAATSILQFWASEGVILLKLDSAKMIYSVLVKGE